MSGGQAWLGYVCLLVAAACFGSNFVPVKHTPTGKEMTLILYPESVEHNSQKLSKRYNLYHQA